MTEETTQIVEINGVKLEIDLRHAKQVYENIRVGSKVKLLKKDDYSGPTVMPGVVIGFENFAELPTIVVCYCKISYSSTDIEFAYINDSKKSKEKWSMIPALDDDMAVDKLTAENHFASKIKKAEREIEDIKEKRDYFLRTFGEYFSDVPVTSE